MNWLTRRLCARYRRPAAVLQRKPFRPKFETLEERAVPARPLPYPVIYVGAEFGAPPTVQAYNAETGELNFERIAFESGFTGGVHVTTADFTNDGYPDLVVAPGTGGGPRVRVLDGKTGEQIPGPIGNFWAYAPGFRGGVELAAADVNGDKIADIITGASRGGGPHIRVFDGVTGEVIQNFMAFDPDFRGGVSIAAADFSGDGRSDIAVGAGPDGGPHVKIFDLATGRLLDNPLGNFFAFDPSFRGGVNLGSDWKAGDVSGDRVPDLIIAPGFGHQVDVQIYSGSSGRVLRTIQAFPSTMTAGARVATAYVNDDTFADIVVATAKGVANEMRVFDGQTGEHLEGSIGTYQPFGEGSQRGINVAASNDPPPVGGTPLLSETYTLVGANGETVDMTVTVTADVPGYEGKYFWNYHLHNNNFHTDDFAAPPYDLPKGFRNFGLALIPGRTAIDNYDLDHAEPTLLSEYFQVYSFDDALAWQTESMYTAVSHGVSEDYLITTIPRPIGRATGGVLSLVSTVDNNLGASYFGPNWLTNNWLPVPSFIDISDLDLSVCLNELISFGTGVSGPKPATSGVGGVRLGDGKVSVSSPGLSSEGWGHQSSWSNTPGYVTGVANGNGWGSGYLPRLIEHNGSLIFSSSPGNAYYFDDQNGTYVGRRSNSSSTITLDSSTQEYVLKDGTGKVIRFENLNPSVASLKDGTIKSFTDEGGNVTNVTSRDSRGRPTEFQRSVGSSTESYLYEYYSSSEANTGRVKKVTLRRGRTGSWTNVRSVENSYYVEGNSNGNVGDLKQVLVKDPSGNIVDRGYYRYYTSTSSPGYVGGLKYAFGGEAYDRLLNAYSNPDTATDGQIDDYADVYYEYDSTYRVTKAVIAGSGCSMCSAGLGTFTYEYVTSGHSNGVNNWKTKTIESLPDGGSNTYYTNYLGQVLLKEVRYPSSTTVHRTYTRYDSEGRPLLSAEPAAVTGANDTYADLLNFTSNNAEFLSDSSGLYTVYAYGGSTTATSTVAGEVAGRVSSTSIRLGETGTNIPQSEILYFERSVGSDTRYFNASTSVYRETNGTGIQTTSVAYTWHSGTFEPASIVTTMPIVTTGQNGSGSANTISTFFDAKGRAIWSKDQAGFLTYNEYDQNTGAVVKQITDVDTTQTSTFSNLPSGWSTPSGGGLHLTSTYEVDSLGRTTKATSPNGRIDYTVYDDENFEVRFYPGWNTSTNLPTGPTSVSRDDRGRGYTESLTMSATPNVSGGRPTGTESISNLQSLSRSYRNLANQVTTSDSYFDFTGMSYSTSSNIGTLNTNYYRTTTDYGKQVGQANRQVSALGTITRTEYDSQGRVTSQWIGTDDTPSSGYWATNNLTGTDMTKVAEYEYDANGNLTKQTQIPGGGAANRVTETYYDWRNRPVAVKGGVESSESTSVNRPIHYTDYDNLGRVIKTRLYDGDGVSITDGNSDGIPDAPSGSLLRAQSTQSYDELGRVYLSETYSVDPSSGSVGSNTLKSNTWYDSRGMVIKSSSPGGLVQKSVYDGAGRLVTSYVSDGGGDSSYADADDVTGDKVLEQSETAYDASGNVLSQTSRQRNHDTTGTGALGTASTGNHARVSYAAMYYDVGDRLTATANYGTNGAASWSRAGSVPTRSDTILVTSFDYDSAGRQWKVTDPKAIESRTYFDAMGRTTKTIENYVDGTVGDDNDKTTEYTYNAAGMTTLKALLTGGGFQTTEWIYGVTGAIVSNDIVSATRWPDPSSGNSSSGQQDTVTVNALGQTLTSTDRNGTVHTLAYDILGRLTTDTVTTLGTNINGAVRRVETAYDGQGNAYLLTNYDATTNGNIVNQVQRAFNGLGQMTIEWQSHSGAVNTGSSPKVQYAYSEMPSGANHSRPVSMTYPNGRVIDFNYGVALDDAIGRLSALKDGATTLESYDYLGLGTVVKRGHAQSGVDLTFIKASGEGNGDAGDQYTGLDRYGRIVDQRWRTSSVEKDRYQYTYDRNGNRTAETNALSSSFNEAYSYDNLNQLTGFNRNSGARTQSWDYDALGNWESVTTDATTQTRTHNRQNEITAVSGATSPVFDAAGNMTTDETGKQYVFDAWNRLVTVKNSGGTTIASYAYDPLTRRVSETASSTTTDLYYSSQWQVVEERVSGNATKSYVWSPVYVDAMISRDRDTDANGSLDERLYVIHDANFNVTGLVNTSGTVVERYTYDPFGAVTVHDGSWTVTSTAYVWQYLHQGGRLSGQSGLYSFRYREFSPTLGKWVSLDPIKFAASDTNMYRYASNSPVVMIDASGLSDYKLGSDDPKIVHDEGSGVWGSRPMLYIWAQIKKEAIYTALGLTELFMRNATDHMMHYLSNSGSTYTINLQGMIADVPSAKKLYLEELEMAKSFARTLSTSDGKWQDFTSNRASSGYNKRSESKDWYFAVGGYSAWGKGSVKIESCNAGRKYTMKFEYNFSDRYNWDSGKSWMPGLGDEILQELHQAGVAQEFDMIGKHVSTHTWVDDGKSIIPVFTPSSPRQGSSPPTDPRERGDTEGRGNVAN